MKHLLAVFLVLFSTEYCARSAPSRKRSPVVAEYVRKAKDAWRAEKYDQALVQLDMAIGVDPGDAGLHNFHGVINLYFKGQHPAARSDFATAISLAPRWAFPYRNRGWSYFMQSQCDAALRDFQKTVDIEPSQGFPYFTMGVVHYYNRRYEEGSECFALGTDKDPSFTLNAIWRYLAEAKLGRQSREQLLSSGDGKAHHAESNTISLLSGEMTIDAYLKDKLEVDGTSETAVPKPEWSTRHRKSEAHFWIGQRCLLMGEEAEARKHFKLSARHGAATMCMEAILSPKELSPLK
ncbi:MAG: hypothetical protein HQ523_12410 [Lentisphaerae bacterium]|nr:hypothetical protein [Lentisphaerota bacterium]